MLDILVTNVKLPGQSSLANIGVFKGKFNFIGDETKPAKTSINGFGCLAMPALVECHAHLDKNFSGTGIADQTDATALERAIAAMQHVKANRSAHQIKSNARLGIEQAITKGVGFLRSHLDFGSAEDMSVIETMLEIREEYASNIHIQYCLLGSLDTAEKRLLAAEAIDMGIDLMGGAPSLSENPELSIRQVMDFAEQQQCGIDLHIDETQDPSSNCLGYLADQVLERQFSLPVMAGHCCSLAFKPAHDRARIIDRVAEAKIDVVTLPACNLVLIGDGVNPSPRGTPPIKEMMAAGINVCAGSDNVQDPFHPWGNYDPFGTAHIAAATGQLYSTEFEHQTTDLITKNAAKAFRLPDYGLMPGMDASFCLIESSTPEQAIADQPFRSWVIHKGQLVLKQNIQQEWLYAETAATSATNF